jgi:hypothetical protein
MNRSHLLTVGRAFIRSMGLLLGLVLSLPGAVLAQDWAAPGASQVRVMPFPEKWTLRVQAAPYPSSPPAAGDAPFRS